MKTDFFELPIGDLYQEEQTMKAKPVKLIDQQWVQVPKEEATHVELCFPLEHISTTCRIDPPYTYYPLKTRFIPIQLSGTRAESNNWSWNGDTERPTLKPSILTEVNYAGTVYRCHSFVNAGVVEFLQDCSHDKAGQKLPLVKIGG